MSNDENDNLQPDPDEQQPAFGLNEPTGQFGDLDEQMKSQAETEPVRSRAPQTNNPDDVKFKPMGWKGIDQEDEEEEIDEPFAFEKKEIPEDELDMTPMVDVTFLLLIFFMVTAAFTLQKSLEQPHAQSEDPSTNVQDNDEQPDDYIQINIDQNNTYYVTTRDEDEVECPSESEMRARVKDAKTNSSATRLIIRAHEESYHAKVVTAWDAGLVNDLNQIEIQVTDEDF